MSAASNVVELYLKRNAVATQYLNWTVEQRYHAQIESMRRQGETLDDLTDSARITLMDMALEVYPENLAEELHVQHLKPQVVKELEEIRKGKDPAESIGVWHLYLAQRVAEETIQRSLER